LGRGNAACGFMSDDKYKTIQVDAPVMDRFDAICKEHAPHTKKVVFEGLVLIAEGLSVPKVREAVTKAYNAKDKD
jgi:hypothetical protein